jgi:hypothetical protein
LYKNEPAKIKLNLRINFCSPGNILLLEDGRLGLIDYGQVKFLTVQERKRCAQLIVNLAKNHEVGKVGKKREREEGEAAGRGKGRGEGEGEKERERRRGREGEGEKERERRRGRDRRLGLIDYGQVKFLTVQERKRCAQLIVNLAKNLR